MALYKLNFMFDWGAGTCVWSANEAARERYGCLASLRQLPVSAGLLQTLLELCSRHDEALNWSCPAEPLLWSREQCEAFFRDAQSGYERLCEELGAEYDIAFCRNAVI